MPKRNREIYLRVLDALRSLGQDSANRRVVDHRGDCMFVGDDDRIDFVVKIRPTGLSLLNIARSRRFRTEAVILKYLHQRRFTHLKTPLVVAADFSDFFVEKYIDGSHFVTCGTYCQLIVRAVFEFNTCADGTDLLHHPSHVLLGTSPLTRMVRSALQLMFSSARLPAALALRGLALAVRLYCRQSALPVVYLMHNDLGNTGNCVIRENGDVYMLDFGGARLARKFILLDIVMVALNMETVSLDFRCIVEYVELMPAELRAAIDLARQVHFCLLVRFFYLLNHQPEDYAPGGRQYEFLARVLLDEKVFGEWFNAGLRDASQLGSRELPALRNIV